MSARSVIAEAILCERDVLAALADDGYAVVKSADLAQDLVATRAWQQSALTVITAANQFILDCVTGDGDPRKLAAALIESGFDGRVQR